ncbi:taurine catabolism dioxygenase TauD, TfdA [Seminavis robusta]|uniref:Taurine catabolism dioxygenase TauD, TfdA n=1 Tax=Seminavis robusta TaxID=568900 RepID=A0A9N8DFC3_9STRA|nr:taurine catabolism dioxygenase TauD, TfdA [Seminavis robusta]|eukprot:Sro114_g056320.1 taurine catabolism dioxygenase TauD, TfdA (380) ;mRNA; r:36179-37318
MASFTDNEDARRKSSINTHEYFVPVAEGLNTKEGISFDPSWLSPRFWSPEEAKKAHLPANLPAPDFVQVFQLDQQASSTKEATLQQVGKSAYDIANACLSTSATSAVLFRGLSAKILNAKDFTDFWKACLAEPSSKNRKKWNPVSYVPFGVQRNTLEGIDLVTNFPPENALACHNEMVYNPQPAGRIAFYCLEAAPDGGETILARNVDHSRHVSQELQGMVRKHGGIQYTRRYYDKRNPNEDSSNRFHVSWQEKTGTQDPNEAIHFFESVGFSVPDQVHFETYDDGFQKLIVKNVESGFNAQGNWFNILNMGMFPLADGTVVPKAMIQQLVLDEWRSVHALKLVPGDWIVLNNQTLQHGRLPYRNSGEQKRTILTVYTD